MTHPRKIPFRCSKWRVAAVAGGVALLAGVAALLGGGCASVVPHRNQSAGRASLPLAGLYDLTFHTVDAGSVTGRIAAEPTRGGGFRANSRPGAVRKLVGGFRGMFAPLVARQQFGGGALLHWNSVVPARSGHGEIRLPIGTFVLDLPTWEGPAELQAANGRLAGFVTLRAANPTATAGTDRLALVARIEQAFHERLYDPSLCAAPGVRAYFARLRELSATARDDMEFLFGAFVARKKVPFSHLGLLRKLDPSFAPRLQPGSQGRPPDLELNWQGSVATIRVHGFWQAEDEIDRLFEQVRRQQAAAVIVDLRGCPGGDYSSMRIAAHLLAAPADAGVLFGPAARADVLAGKLDRFPQVNRLRSVEQLTDLVRTHGALCFRVEPTSEPFTGKVAVLINRGTASAAEPLAALLQASGRAQLFGARTGGAMLSSERVDVGEGWVLQIPVFDYVTAAGTRLERNGVSPDVACDPTNAPRLALEYVRDDHLKSEP